MDGRGGMLELASAAHSYSEKGKYKIAMKVIDIWGERHDEGGGGEGMTVKAVYENGVFKPTSPVDLPERTQVEFDPKVLADQQDDQAAQQRIYELLGQSVASGETDVAARHDEHQP